MSSWNHTNVKFKPGDRGSRNCGLTQQHSIDFIIDHVLISITEAGALLEDFVTTLTKNLLKWNIYYVPSSRDIFWLCQKKQNIRLQYMLPETDFLFLTINVKINRKKQGQRQRLESRLLA